MPTRQQITDIIGNDYLQSNIEAGEWNYHELLTDGRADREKVTVSGRVHEKLDMRFADDRVSVLVETKRNFDRNFEANKQQLQCYVEFEKVQVGHGRIIAILVNTEDDRIKVWNGAVDDESLLANETELRSFEDYRARFFGTSNDKNRVVQSTYELNEILHGRGGMNVNLRSRFVGLCLLALKTLPPERFDYHNLTPRAIVSSMEDCLHVLFEENNANTLERAGKLAMLKNDVLDTQDVTRLSRETFVEILDKVRDEILPFINDRTQRGQDILNLFFTTFNKYVGKSDKNQAFTPSHIVHFLCRVAQVNRNSRVLDPCCGSGAFLVRALTDAVDDCRGNRASESEIKAHHIFGIEEDRAICGLATTNMLIHGDGNSNVICANCFEREDWIRNARIDTVLMNPPFNAQRVKCHQGYARHWPAGNEDPTKGFHFVEYVANTVGRGKLVAILPYACAIGTEGNEMLATKERMLQRHHLDAVFSLPADVFHPGASVCACCLVFDLGMRHDDGMDTFFGYFRDDGFMKKKNYGRVERREGIWDEIERRWLHLYRNRIEERGISAVRRVAAGDEWLCEAYMETDVARLEQSDFEKTLRDYIAFQIQTSAMP